MELLNFLAVQLEAKVSTETLTRQTLRERISLHLSELLDRMRYVIDQVERNGERRVLFIVEDIDKLNLANARDLFLEHARSLTTVPASIIYTYPVALRNSLDFNYRRGQRRTGHHRDERRLQGAPAPPGL